MKMVRISALVMVAFVIFPRQAQAQCSWNETQSGVITETCGSVGIGTTAPVSNLHLKNYGGSNDTLLLVEGASGGQTRIKFKADREWTFGILPIVTGAQKLVLYDFTGNVQRMVFDPVANGVAFGNFNAPWGGLHVLGAGQAAANPTLTSASSSVNGATLFLQDTGSATGSGGMVAFGAGLGHFAALKGSLTNNTNNTTGDLLFLTRAANGNANLTERMRITGESGALLIGPGVWDIGAKLHVTDNVPGHIWTAASTYAPTITTSGTSFSYALAGRNWSAPVSGVTVDGATSALYLEATNRGTGGFLANTVGEDITTGVFYGYAGSVGTAKGSNIRIIGNVTTGYGVYIEDLSAATSWGIYQVGTNDMNYFAGKIGIGTAPTANALEVAGNANFTGTVTGGNIQAKYQDVAEWVPSRQDLQPGTVVVLEPTITNTVTQSTTAYDITVAGVVSAQPGIVLGVGDSSKEQIATTGRVKVRVDATRAAIHIGDLLVTSDTPGMAMKSQPVALAGIAIHRPGTIIGKALEPLAGGQGEILVLLSLQ